MDKFNRFRNENPVFIYDSYSFSVTQNTVEVSYRFVIPGLAEFTPGWSFPLPDKKLIENNHTFEKLVFSLGLAEAVSYWKAVCSPEFHIKCGWLDDKQIIWWKKLWYMGLGEFFYVNGIKTDIDSFVSFVPLGKPFPDSDNIPSELNGCLVPVGGGKDSALTLETLCSAGMDCRCYSINKRCSISQTVTAAGLGEDALLTASRRFDRSLIELNKKGYLNGHTPFSAIVAFSAEITAYLHGLKYIVLSNEASANESTVVGEEVNHQYSKSFEFERDFHEYEQNYLKTGIYYFSFLRPLAEFQIAKMFVSHKKYLPVFRSCNLGSKVSPDIWCGECPKCLFVCLILSPFLSRSELNRIFGVDMLDSSNMLTYFTELVGLSEHKPFECVGSIDEVRLAVSLAIRDYKENGEELPLLFREFVKLGLYAPDSIDEKNNACCKSWNDDNLLTDTFKEILKKEMERLL